VLFDNKKIKIIITESQYNTLLLEQDERNSIEITDIVLKALDDDDEILFNRFLNKRKFDEITFDFPTYEIETPNIDKLPDNMIFQGDLKLSLPNLEKLPNNLLVNGDLHIFAPKVAELPEDLTVDGLLEIINTGIILDNNQANAISEKIGANGIFTKGNLKISIDIDLIDSDDYLNVGRDYSKDIFRSIFGDDSHEWYSYYDSDIKSAIDYYVDTKNTEIIEALVQKYVDKNNMDTEELEEMDLVEKINYLDLDEIKSALQSAESDSANQAYQAFLVKEVISAYDDYGYVEEISWDKIRLTVELSESILDMDEDEFSNKLSSCGTDLECWFNEMKGNEIDIPSFSPDERYSPSPDKKDFNEILSDRLLDVEHEMFN
jgi:hypothetical protein